MRGTLSSIAMAGAFVSLIAFTAQEVDARGGRGGGGMRGGGGASMSRGGGGGFSRGGGGRSSGSFNRSGASSRSSGGGFSRGGGSYSRPGGGSYSRPSGVAGGSRQAGRPSQMPSTGMSRGGRSGATAQRPGQGGAGTQRPGTRPGQGGAGSQRPGQGGQRPSQRPGQGGDRTQIGGGDRTQIGGGDRNVNRGDRNTNINNDIDIDNDWGGGDWDGWGGWYDHPIAGGIAIGAVAGLTAAAVYGSAYYALPGGCSPYPYYTYTYYQCGAAWYQPQYEGDTVVYVTVPDPSTGAPPPQQ